MSSNLRFGGQRNFACRPVKEMDVSIAARQNMVLVIQPRKYPKKFRIGPIYAGGIPKGASPLCVVAGVGFIGEGPHRKGPAPMRLFGYFLSAQKVTQGPGAEPPKSFGKKHVSPPPARRRANLSPSAPIAGTERSNPGCGAGEAPFYPRGVNPTDSSTSRPASETTKSRKSWACSWCSLMFSTAAG